MDCSGLAAISMVRLCCTLSKLNYSHPARQPTASSPRIYSFAPLGRRRSSFSSLSLCSSLSGSLDNEGSGFGAISFSRTGIQNGSPDGLVLVDPTDSVLQFLSYEGSFTALSGTAIGTTSIDIGVTEPGTTPIGQSLQLTGIGSIYSDFSWTGPASESPGNINVGQSFVRQSVPEVGSSAILLIIGLSSLALAKRKRLDSNERRQSICSGKH